MIASESRSRLSVEHLSQFAVPKTWREIVAIKPFLRRASWLAGIMAADEHADGTLEWVDGRWGLTAKGRAFLADGATQ